MATSMKIALFCDVAPCSPVDILTDVSQTYCLHHKHFIFTKKLYVHVSKAVRERGYSRKEE
jgi:hypothetical protein